MPTYRESLICFTLIERVSYAKNKPNSSISPLMKQIIPGETVENVNGMSILNGLKVKIGLLGAYKVCCFFTRKGNGRNTYLTKLTDFHFRNALARG